ncbi:lipase [Canibacter zhuwentaonis]|uniref:lipase n=1 Tax=Canibacter zhuwentaonis TaxID=2837491 RepID=UPI002028DA54|nr:lipase [Canibacter zhuwentaonis]
MHKALIVAAVAVFASVHSIAPAFADQSQEYDFSVSASPALGPVTSQTLATTADDLINESLQALTTATVADFNNIAHGFDVEVAIALAKSEVGTSRPTGWSAPGECIMSAQRWIRAGGGNWYGGIGTPVGNYANAIRLPASAALPGDIIQYEHLGSPDSWVTGVHTVLVTGVNPDGTLQIIQSNIPAGSGLVTEVKNFKPTPPAGFQAVVWRF